MRTYTLAGSALLIAFLGCSDPPPADVAFEDFCAEWTTAYCRTAVLCRCADGLTTETCLAQPCPLQEGSILAGGVGDGSLSYDPAAAGRFLDTLRRNDCRSDPRPELNQRDYQDLFGTLDGTIEPGQPCTVGPGPDGCRSGLCDQEAGVCVGRVALGEPCGDSVQCAQPADLDRDRMLRCLAGECAPLGQDGEACTLHADCLKGPCEDSVCLSALEIGAGCDEDLECDAGNCDFSTGRCRAQEPVGGLCTEHSNCSSGWCAERLSIAAGHCMEPLGIGEPCSEDEACVSAACVAAECRPPICLKAD